MVKMGVARPFSRGIVPGKRMFPQRLSVYVHAVMATDKRMLWCRRLRARLARVGQTTAVPHSVVTRDSCKMAYTEVLLPQAR